MANTPRHELPLMSNATEQQWSVYSNAMKYIDARLNGYVLNSTNTPPGSPAEGDMYIVKATATGLWAAQENKLAFYINATWIFLTPTKGQIVFNETTKTFHRWNGTIWTTLGTGGGFGDGFYLQFSWFAQDTLKNGELLFYYVTVSPFELPIDLVDSRVVAGTPSTDTKLLYVRKNDVIVGEITFSAGNPVAALTMTSLTSFAKDDLLSITAQVAPPDVTLADVTGTLIGARI